jgi:hypothetical protein
LRAAHEPGSSAGLIGGQPSKKGGPRHRLFLISRRRSIVSSPTRILFWGPNLAAWIARACGLGGIAAGVEDVGQAATGRANGADRFGGAVRAAVGEHQRLLETQEVGQVSASGHFAFDQVKSPIVIEQPNRRATAVSALDAELTA